MEFITDFALGEDNAVLLLVLGVLAVAAIVLGAIIPPRLAHHGAAVARRRAESRASRKGAARASAAGSDAGDTESSAGDTESAEDLEAREAEEGIAPADEDDEHAPPSPAAYLMAQDEDPSQAYERADSEDHQLEMLREGLAGLDARSRDIIARRWLDADSKVTLQELADEYGVSAERIRQIEANAMKKMRALLAA